MLTKRNLLMMLTIIVVILELFLFTVVLKEYYNDYDVNHMADKNVVAKSEQSISSNAAKAEQVVLYFGKEDNGYFSVIKEWAQYRKKAFTAFSSLDEAEGIMEEAYNKPSYLLVDGQLLEANVEHCALLLTGYVNSGAVVVFYRMPSYNTIKGCKTLRDLLGIQHMRGEEVKVKEIRLYSGFLLGGETHYSFEGVKDPERVDIQDKFPWYDVSSRTKTYMAGFVTEAEKASLNINNEDMPAIIWRSNMGKGSVFAVNGDYIKTCGMGILDAMLYEAEEYSLYSVVNAQNLFIAGFPDLTNENEQQMSEVYGMTAEQFCRDILWPSFVAMAQKQNWRLTCFVSAKQNDSSNNAPKIKNLTDYLKYFNEESAEAGVSLGRIGSSNLSLSVKDEKNLLEQLNINYMFACGYVRGEHREKLKILIDKNGKLNYFGDIQSVVGEYSEDEPILSWLTDTITLQNATTNAYRHSYKDSLMLKSIETALGYTNAQVDIYRILWPKDEKDQWQNLADKLAANIDTYWKPFSVFDKTTVSQSDVRVRNFLNGNVQSSKNGNTITVQTQGFNNDAYLLLRTHGEQITDIKGGTFKKAEKDAYLLHITEDNAEITLKPEIELYYKYKK